MSFSRLLKLLDKTFSHSVCFLFFSIIAKHRPSPFYRLPPPPSLPTHTTNFFIYVFNQTNFKQHDDLAIDSFSVPVAVRTAALCTNKIAMLIDRKKRKG